jgi:hypothetical protein
VRACRRRQLACRQPQSAFVCVFPPRCNGAVARAASHVASPYMLVDAALTCGGRCSRAWWWRESRPSRRLSGGVSVPH